jgi:hypothetical protein
MKTIDDQPKLAPQGIRLVGHPGEVAQADGAYRCLCCGVVVWHLRKGRRFPECPTHNCPTMWLWYPSGRLPNR